VRKHFYTATKCESEFRALFSLPFDMAKGCRVTHHKRRPVEINVLRLIENARGSVSAGAQIASSDYVSAGAQRGGKH